MNTTTSTGRLNAAISARILVLVSKGATLPAAVDQVLGAGTYARLAGEVFESLRGSR